MFLILVVACCRHDGYSRMYRTVTVQVAVFFRWAAALPVGSTQNPFPSVVPSRCDGSGVLFHSGGAVDTVWGWLPHQCGHHRGFCGWCAEGGRCLPGTGRGRGLRGGCWEVHSDKIVVRLEWNAAGSGWIVYFDALLLMLWACTGAKNTLLFSHQFRFKWWTS